MIRLAGTVMMRLNLAEIPLSLPCLLAQKGKPAKLTGQELALGLAPVSTSLVAELYRYDTKGGQLYRRTGDEFELIRDFSEMAFEPVRAPYDWREDHAEEDGPKPWHPLDSEGRS